MQRLTIRLSVALVTFLLGITSSSLVHTLHHDAASSAGVAEQEVLQVEREYIRAHMERDLPALDRVLADDFSSFNGRVNKARRLALIANPDFTIRSLATTDVHVRAAGDEAWVSGRARMQVRYQEREFTTPPYQFTRHYEKRAGRWQVVSLTVAPAW